jgi:hypothetical protein
MRSVEEDLYAGLPVFQFIWNQQCIDWWINFDKEVVEQKKTVNTIFCFRKNTIHDRLLECVQKHFSQKSLRRSSQETGISQGYVQAATKLLHLKPYKFTESAEGKLCCDGMVFRMVVSRSVHLWWFTGFAKMARILKEAPLRRVTVGV